MISSPTEREMSRIILSLKPLKNKCMISGLLVRVRSPSRENSEDVEILETHKERTFSEPQVDESATGEALPRLALLRLSVSGLLSLRLIQLLLRLSLWESAIPRLPNV